MVGPLPLPEWGVVVPETAAADAALSIADTAVAADVAGSSVPGVAAAGAGTPGADVAAFPAVASVSVVAARFAVAADAGATTPSAAGRGLM